MQRWINLLSGAAIVATVAHVATMEAVRHNQRPAPEGWKPDDDPGRFVRRSPRATGRPCERTGAREAPHRDLLLESGVVAPRDNPLALLRRSGLI